MDTPDLTQSLPDPSWVMPNPEGEILLAIFGGAAVIFAVYCAFLSYTKRTWLPLIFAAAGAASIMLEPIADTLGNVQHPPVDQINAFTVDGQPIPLAILLAYVWYFGLAQVLMWDKAEKRTMTPKRWWQAALGAFLAVTLVEQIPIALGLWEYYGEQPLALGLMPADMLVANTVSVMLPAMLCYALWPMFKQGGLKQLLPLAVVPIAVVGGHTAAAAPSYMFINANPNDVTWWMLDFGGAVTVVFSLVILWLSIGFLHGRFPEITADRQRMRAEPLPDEIPTVEPPARPREPAGV